ncbi:MAG: MBL fold metallo-hydrolase [Candidatus Latescibacteria bacterium]|nr:MBL fold metallo-hydrolase [Candidatus Latescibacterota bacterium]
MFTQLEDQFGDVIAKARRGQELSVASVAGQAGLTQAELEGLEGGGAAPDPTVVRRLAQGLGLDAEKLVVSAEERYFPLYPAGRPAEGLSVEMLVLGSDFLVNGYLVGCTETNKGLVIDPGFDAEKILRAIENAGLEIELVLLTHGHGDHVGALSEICQATGAPAFIDKDDLPLLGELRTKIEGSIVEGEVFSVGRQSFRACKTPGHTAGGVCLVHPQVAFVGDAIFAGSMGGTRRQSDYSSLQGALREKVLGLDERVVLYPGHGPATTVGEERAHNPFFSGLAPG